MQQIETVNIDDVFPLEDEYGNCITQRDMGSKANQTYIKALADTFRDGVPDTPPILVRDEGIFRIKDGNCRIAAMRMLGTKRFPAIIDDAATTRDIVETVVRTNTKKRYEPVEESRFVQQLAMFADDEYVAKAAGIKAAQVPRIRKGAQLAGESAVEMTLDRLLAIEEFSDEPDTVQALINISERDFPDYYKRLTKARKANAKRLRIARALSEYGITVLADIPDHGYTFMRLIYEVGHVGSIPSDCVAVGRDDGYFAIYAPTDDEDAEVNNRLREMAAYEREKVSADRVHRYEWLRQAIDEGNSLRTMKNMAHDWLAAHVFPPAPLTSKDLQAGTADVIVAMIDNRANDSETGIYTNDFDTISEWCAKDFVDLLNVMVADGYEPTDHEREMFRIATKHLEETHEKDQ